MISEFSTWYEKKVSYQSCIFYLTLLLQGGAPTSYTWSYNLYKWCYKWATEVITPISGVITPFITGFGAHLVVGVYCSSCPWIIAKRNGLPRLVLGANNNSMVRSWGEIQCILYINITVYILYAPCILYIVESQLCPD